MATKIITKNSSTATSIPTAGDLVQGELAVNVTDKRLFTEDSGGAIVELGTNPSTLTSGAATFSSDVTVNSHLEVQTGGVGETASFGGDDASGARALQIIASTTTGLGDTHTLNATSSTGVIQFATQGLTRATITSAGNVGIGISPSNTFSVGASGTVTTRYTSTDTTTFSLLQFENNGSIVLSADHGNAGANSAIIFKRDGAQESMRIDSSGNVGIGRTSNIDYLLDVQKPADAYIRISSATTQENAGIILANQNGTKWIIEKDGPSHDLFVRSAAVTAMTISQAGNLLVGTTTVPTTNTQGIGFVNSAGFMTLNTSNNQTGATNAVILYNANGLVGTIQTSGSATSYNTSSDYRLKEDDVPMTGATERVKALRPINFAWKVDGSRTDGFFAHEAQEVVPECSTGTKDAMRDEEYEVTPAVEEVRDEDGNVTTEAVAAVMGTRSVPDYQGIDQSKLVPLLTAALQEAIAKIETLEARLEALEGA